MHDGRQNCVTFLHFDIIKVMIVDCRWKTMRQAQWRQWQEFNRPLDCCRRSVLF